MRNVAITRQWRLLLALRRSARTIEELAEELHVGTRTVRRDLQCLRSVGFPIEQRTPDDDSPLWALLSMGEWPRNEIAPVGPLSVRIECDDEQMARTVRARMRIGQMVIDGYS